MKSYSVRNILSSDEREKLSIFSDTQAHLLHHRGIRSNEEGRVFLNSDFDKHRYSPSKLPQIDEAVKRVLEAIEKKEKIVIYSDYDADGIPGAVILHDFFKNISYENFSNYIPHRQDEGFGLHIDAIDGFAKQGATLLITVDCGIAAVDAVSHANKLGIDVIITDHHEPGEKIPEAFAIINPKISRGGVSYEERMLCGAGVAWKFVEAILEKNRLGLPIGFEKWLLDMVGIATLSDMVPLINENRVLAVYGLKVLRKSRRIGLVTLLKKLKIDQKKLTEDDVGFMISPRINAASRMGISYDAFKLLTTNNKDEAEMLVLKLEEVNKERKGATAYLVKEVNKMIEAKYSPYFSNKVIVAGNPAWKPSLLGLVAGALAEKEMKPVFLWGKEGVSESLKGSCRSTDTANVTEIMSKVAPGVLMEYGGHHKAGGFSVSYESVHLLDEEIERAYEKLISVPEEKINWVDLEISPDAINEKILLDIESLAPFGVGNEKPLFLINSADVIKQEFFGKEKNHLKLIIRKQNGLLLEAITFFAPEDLIQKTASPQRYNIVGNLERSFFGKTGKVRIRISDVV